MADYILDESIKNVNGAVRYNKAVDEQYYSYQRKINFGYCIMQDNTMFSAIMYLAIMYSLYIYIYIFVHNDNVYRSTLSLCRVS